MSELSFPWITFKMFASLVIMMFVLAFTHDFVDSRYSKLINTLVAWVAGFAMLFGVSWMLSLIWMVL